MSSLGSLLRLMRAREGLQQSEMAEKLGITPNFLSQVENEKKNVSFSKLEEIACTLGFSKELLIIAASDVPKELNDTQKDYFLKMQKEILSLLLFEKK